MPAKRIHFVWLGPLPDWAAANMEAFARLNPDYPVTVHQSSAPLLEEFAEAYRAARTVGMQADLLRLSVLRRFGGWYFDADVEPRRPLRDLPIEVDDRLLIGEVCPKQDFASNAILAAGPECRLWPTIIDYVASGGGRDWPFRWGPDLASWLVREHRADLVLPPPEWFPPTGPCWTGRLRRRMAGPREADGRAFAVHQRRGEHGRPPCPARPGGRDALYGGARLVPSRPELHQHPPRGPKYRRPRPLGR